MLRFVLITDNDISTIDKIDHVVLLFIALFMALFGYRFFRLCMIFQGAILGGYLGYFIAAAIASDSDTASTHLAIDITALVCGLVGGGLSWCFKSAMLFVFGVTFGIQIASLSNILFLHNISSSHPNQVGYVVMAGSALFFGCLTTCATRMWHVMLTAIVGSYWTISALGFFAGGFPSTFAPFKKNDTNIPSAFYGYVLGWLMLSIFSMMIQFYWTAKHVHHHKEKEEDEEEDYEADHPKPKRAGYYSLLHG